MILPEVVRKSEKEVFYPSLEKARLGGSSGPSQLSLEKARIAHGFVFIIEYDFKTCLFQLRVSIRS